jgi:hypothetical protein
VNVAVRAQDGHFSERGIRALAASRSLRIISIPLRYQAMQVGRVPLF